MIRKANINDREAIIKLFKQLVAHHVKIVPDFYRMPQPDFLENGVDSTFSDENKEIWINDKNGSDNNKGINAYAVIKLINVDYPDRYPYKMCYIDCFGVKEDCRHQGVGTALMEAVKNRARELGCQTLQLKVSAVNKEAVSFYEKMRLTPHEIVMTEKLS